MNNPVIFIDPLGLICIYSQSSGTLFCWNDQVGVYLDEEAYSGAGVGKNNPEWDDVPNIGPIPKGTYTVGPSVTVPGKTIPGKQLIPDAITKATFPEFREDWTFYIHGGYPRNSKKYGTASEGCIILNKTPRGKIPVGETVIVVE